MEIKVIENWSLAGEWGEGELFFCEGERMGEI